MLSEKLKFAAAPDSLVKMWEKKGIWINILACLSFIKGRQ